MPCLNFLPQVFTELAIHHLDFWNLFKKAPSPSHFLICVLFSEWLLLGSEIVLIIYCLCAPSSHQTRTIEIQLREVRDPVCHVHSVSVQSIFGKKWMKIWWLASAYTHSVVEKMKKAMMLEQCNGGYESSSCGMLHVPMRKALWQAFQRNDDWGETGKAKARWEGEVDYQA